MPDIDQVTCVIQLAPCDSGASGREVLAYYGDDCDDPSAEAQWHQSLAAAVNRVTFTCVKGERVRLVCRDLGSDGTASGAAVLEFGAYVTGPMPPSAMTTGARVWQIVDLEESSSSAESSTVSISSSSESKSSQSSASVSSKSSSSTISVTELSSASSPSSGSSGSSSSSSVALSSSSQSTSQAVSSSSSSESLSSSSRSSQG